ncbi:MAG: N-acyl-D-amino-acid deacylase family protein [Chloroflexota bacterium]
MAFDLVILGGTVVDGTGAPGFRADVGVEGQRVAAVGDLSAATARRYIDATGLTVTPGFIDTHAHAEGALLVDPQHACGIRQGVTTEILCPDGLSYAPLSPEIYRMYRRYLSGILGLPPEDLDMSSIHAFRGHYHRKTACNVATFIGHGPVRLSALGMRDAPLTGDALEHAKRLIREGLEQGAVGFSTGLSYYPNAYSDTEELVELCKVAAEFGLPYSVHLRDHNRDRAFGNGGVAEALEVGRRSGVPVHLEHYRTQPNTAGDLASVLDPVEQAKAQGVDVTMESYVYPVGSTFPPSFFPGEFHEGGPDAALDRLRDPEKRAGYVRHLNESPSRPIGSSMWTSIGSQRNQHLVGMTFDDAAALRGVSVGEMICDVMLEEELTCGFRQVPPDSIRTFRQVEADIMELLARPDYMVGSDAIPAAIPFDYAENLVHPRAYGCFARFVGRLRRRYGYPLEQVVQRVTQNPAERFKLKDRGVLAKGKFADIVVFGADRINDQSSFEDPAVHPSGIPYVLVNGQVAVDNERVTGVMAGEAVP